MITNDLHRNVDIKKDRIKKDNKKTKDIKKNHIIINKIQYKE